MARKGNKSRGRKKIEIKKIESEDARHVCFSKRRIGVFTKASELSTMCGAHVAVVVHSPSGTPYSFGSPSVNSVINSFLTQSPVMAPPANSTHEYVINKLNKEYMEVSNKLHAEKQKKAMLDQRANDAVMARELELLIKMDQLSLDELNLLLPSLYQAKNWLNERIMALLLGMSGNFDGVSGAIVQSSAASPAPSSGAIIGPINYASNPFMPASI
ncbi:agamous-like MADS-box protein AGL62 [Carex rostrata]